jgi:hypothetical protein
MYSLGFVAVAPVPRSDFAGDLLTVSACVADPVVATEWDGSPWFADLDAVRRAVTRPDQVVLDVGITAEDVPAVLDDLADGGWDAAAGIVPDRLRQEVPVAPGATLGYELLAFGGGALHTVHCLGGYAADVAAATGARPAALGLYPSGEAARQAARWLTERAAGDQDIFLWFPAALVRPSTPPAE